MQALLRYPRRERRAVAREWARRSQAVQAERRRERGPDLDTLRWRARHDRRGQVLREGVTFFGDGRVVPWRVQHSLRGRVDQFDVVVAGRIWRTAGPRKLPLQARPLVIPQMR